MARHGEGVAKYENGGLDTLFQDTSLPSPLYQTEKKCPPPAPGQTAMYVRYLETPGTQRPECSSPGCAEAGSKTAADPVHMLHAKYFMCIILLSVHKTL